MVSKEVLVVDFAANEKGMGFIGRRTASFKDFKINQPIENAIFENIETVSIDETASDKDDEYWIQARHDTLSLREQKIYSMVDTVKSLPVYKTYVDIINIVFTGYYKWGKFEIGPYSTLYSFNQVEGSRVRFGGRTSDLFSKRLRLEGYAAYGFKDKDFKYMAGFKYLFDLKPRIGFGFNYKNDVVQFGESDNIFKESNIFSSVFRRNVDIKLTQQESYSPYFEQEFLSGFSYRIGIDHGGYRPLGGLDFSYYNGPEKNIISREITYSEASLVLRFAYRERFVETKSGRISLGTKHPIFRLAYTYGIKGFLGGDFTYNKLVAKVEDKISLAPFGHIRYTLQAGKSWGNIPYPLLYVHKGNESYFYDKGAFNLMNYYEFVSDQFASLFLVHHFNGFFLDKIPLLRKLKWRELATLRAVYGGISRENRSIMLLPDAIGSLSAKPYVEAGFGVENILKFIRFDFIYRLSYLDNPEIAKYGIRAGLHFAF
jgi:hypothetical protein